MGVDTNRFHSSARYVWRSRITAAQDRRQGRRDAPVLRARLTAPGGTADPYRELLTPYVQGIRAGAERGTDQLRSRLLRTESELCTRIHAESVRVVAQYDIRQEQAPAALARYGGLIGVWRASTEVYRFRAAVLVHEANQRLARYWAAVLTELHPLPGGVLFPPGDPRRLPGRVELDESWQHTDDWLRGDGVPQGSPLRHGAEHPVTRALAILDEQPVRSHG
ncbi:hypothetical protein AB0467_01470 [Streptomyces sp. NPDC052095]|uniref:hypothetical protein n=1 Tax=unclassified Streptomyces TaxID=2593676 RepID=UPI00344FF48B